MVLNWRSSNATSVSIDASAKSLSTAPRLVSPSSSTNVHLVAKDDGGTTEANVRVTVRVPEVPAAPADTSNAGGSDREFHAHVQDIFFGYDSYDLSPPV